MLANYAIKQTIFAMGCSRSRASDAWRTRYGRAFGSVTHKQPNKVNKAIDHKIVFGRFSDAH